MKRLKLISIIFVLSVSMVMFGGCSQGPSTQPNGDQDPTPGYGGDAVVAILNELDSLDPFTAQAAGTKEVFFNIYEGLVKFSPEGSLLPAVAETFKMSDDAKSYSFTLRSGILFHTGEAVTTEDVKSSLERAIAAKTSPALENITSIEIDDATVTINLAEPDNDLLPFLTAAGAAIVPAGYNELSTKPVGTGPFKFVSYAPQQSLVAEKFDDYWMDGVPYLDKVTFKIMPDANAAFLELLAGTVDIYPMLETIYLDQLKDDFNVVLSYRNMVQLLALNNARVPFDDVRVRQALCYLVDVPEIIDTVSNGYGTRTGSAIMPGFKKYFNEDVAEAYTTDVEKAKDLLSEAGYPNGFEFTITVPSNYKFHVDTAQIIVEQLAAGGVKASIEQVEWGFWLERVYMGRDYDATVIGITGELSPKDWLGRYVSDASNNFMNFNSDDYDALYKKASSQTDDEKAVEHYKELQKMLSNDACAVFLQDAQFLNALKKPLTGYSPYPLYVIDMSTIYYAE